MKIRQFMFRRPLGFAAVCALAAGFMLCSCDKDKEKEEETKPSMEGMADFELPAFAMVGEELDLTAGGITNPKEGVSYSWMFGDLDSIYMSPDKISFKLRIPDSIATYSLSLTATAEGYYSSTKTKYVVAIDPRPEGGSLTGIPDAQQTFTDPRDGKTYPVVRVGHLEWFAQNLNWEGAGEAYAKADAAGVIYGRYYTWEDATGGVSASGLGKGVQGVCPEGWSIPTNEDWADLAQAANGGVQVPFEQNWTGIAGKFMVNANLNGDHIWSYSPKVDITNEFGWNAIPAGMAYNGYNNYKEVNVYAFWWSSTQKNENKAFYRYIYNEFPDLSYSNAAKDGMGASVRCVRTVNQ